MANSITVESKVIPIVRGGTGARDVITARSNLAVAKTAGRSDYYVSTSGNDTTGDGTSNNPYKTIAKALSEARYLLRVNLHIAGGTYTENVNVNSKSILFQSMDSNLVTINGKFTFDYSDIYFSGYFKIVDSGNIITAGFSRILIGGVGDNHSFSIQNNGSGVSLWAQNNSLIAVSGEININSQSYGIAAGSNSKISVGSVSNTSSATGLLYWVSNGGILSIGTDNVQSGNWGTHYTASSGGRIYVGNQTAVPNY